MPLSTSYLKARPIRIAVVEDYISMIITNRVTIERSENSENYMDNMHTHNMRKVTWPWNSGCEALRAQLLLIRFILQVDVAAVANAGF